MPNFTMVNSAYNLLVEHFPSLKEFIIFGMPCLVVAFVYLCLAGYLKRHWNWRTGYTRKVFHFLTFLTVSVIQIRWGLRGTILFGSATSITVFYALYKGSDNLFYEAMAREKDEPKRSHYIVMPYLATLVGGILSNILFTPFGAAFGYLVTGFGDAVGEPIGTAFGKHKYKVPSLKGVVSYRSFEGSFAVLLACAIALFIGCALHQLPMDLMLFFKIIGISICITIVEGVSPHGWDNLTTQLAGAGLGFYLFQIFI